jgi:hypothetical protein
VGVAHLAAQRVASHPLTRPDSVHGHLLHLSAQMDGGVVGGRDLELVLAVGGAALLLDGVGDLVGQEVHAEGIVGLVAALGEVDVLADGVGLGPDGAGGGGGLAAGVDPDAGQVGAGRLLELPLEVGRQGLAGGGRGAVDRGLGASGDAVVVAVRHALDPAAAAAHGLAQRSGGVGIRDPEHELRRWRQPRGQRRLASGRAGAAGAQVEVEVGVAQAVQVEIHGASDDTERAGRRV